MAAILLFLFLFAIFALEEWSRRSRMVVPDGATPDPEARIVDVQVKPIGYKSSRRLRTTVFFSDSTKYLTCKSSDSQGILHVHMKVDQGVLEEILADALAAHEKLIASTKAAAPPELHEFERLNDLPEQLGKPIVPPSPPKPKKPGTITEDELGGYALRWGVDIYSALNMLNQVRARKGLPPLALDEDN